MLGPSAFFGIFVGLILAAHVSFYAVRFRFVLIAGIASLLVGTLLVSPVVRGTWFVSTASAQGQRASVAAFIVFLLVAT